MTVIYHIVECQGAYEDYFEYGLEAYHSLETAQQKLKEYEQAEKEKEKRFEKCWLCDEDDTACPYYDRDESGECMNYISCYDESRFEIREIKVYD